MISPILSEFLGLFYPDEIGKGAFFYCRRQLGFFSFCSASQGNFWGFFLGLSPFWFLKFRFVQFSFLGLDFLPFYSLKFGCKFQFLVFWSVFKIRFLEELK
jgi:hypothetical protein